MWYLDTQLHYLKDDKGFKPSFVFIDHEPDLVCKIASIELHSRMYLLGVSTDSLSDWVNIVQNQLNHGLTQGSKLDESGDLDQQANWAKRGIPLWVRDDKLGSEALSLREEEIVQMGQAAEAQAPAAKRKSTGGEPAPKKKKTAPKPQPAKSGTGEEFNESNGDEEEESEEEEEEEPQVSQGKAAKKAAAKRRPEETGARAAFKQPARQSQPRGEHAKPPPKGKTSVAKALASKMQVVPKIKQFLRLF